MEKLAGTKKRMFNRTKKRKLAGEMDGVAIIGSWSKFNFGKGLRYISNISPAFHNNSSGAFVLLDPCLRIYLGTLPLSKWWNG